MKSRPRVPRTLRGQARINTPRRKFVSPEARRVLRAYATGEISRAVAMERLGLTWYGELKDAMARAGVEVVVDRAREAQQVALAIQLLSDKVRPLAVRKMKPVRP